MSIAENVAKILSDIEKAAIAAGRDPKEITLCAATKMNDAARVREAIAAGVRCCGENKEQELTQREKTVQEQTHHCSPAAAAAVVFFILIPSSKPARLHGISFSSTNFTNKVKLQKLSLSLPF